MRKIVVDKKYNQKKLTSFLLDNFNGLTISTIYKSLRKKDIRINNIKTNENCIVNYGDEITLFINDELLFKTFNLDIIYEDNNIVIVNKPVGIEVVSNINSEPTLTTLLLDHYSSTDFPLPCHRLDRNTCGLVIFAKNKKSLDILLEKFKNKEIEKHYKCTVYGIPNKSQATLTSYLFKDRKKSFVYISDIPKKGYQKIITSYKVLFANKSNNTCVLDVNLETR